MNALADAPAETAFEREKRQTNTHYDQDPRVFELFLGRTLKYSSGLYTRGDETLDEAQLKKLAFMTEQLGIKRGGRILDIGCGWGSFVLYLAERHDCEIVGVTPSPRQCAYIQEALATRTLRGRVHIEVAHFQDLRLPPGDFDAISLVGSITHFGDKPGVLAECFRLCRPGGHVYLSETCFRNRETQRRFEKQPGTTFVLSETFGWAELITLSDYVRHLEDAGFSLDSLTDLTKDYRRTIDAWRANVLSSREAIGRLEEGRAERLLRFLDVANAGWGFTSKHYALRATKGR